MPRHALLLLLAGCAAGEASLPDQTKPGTDPTGSTSPTTDTPTSPTTTPTTPTTPLAIDGASARLHPEIPTIVYVSWTQSTDADVHLEYGFDEGEWLSSPVRARAAGAHEELLLGIPYGMEATWRIVAEGVGGTVTTPDQAITVGPRPESMPEVTVDRSDPDRYDPDTPYVYTSVTQLDRTFGDPWWVMIVDRRGRTVWAVQSASGRMSMHPRVSYDGTALLVDQNAFWAQWGLGGDSSVDKIRIDGGRVAQWATPGMHHPYQELPDGSLAFGGYTGWYSESLQITHPDGSRDTLWDCDDFVRSLGESAVCASNTLNYDAASDTFLFSFFTLEAVFQIDGTTGETLRWFGHVNGAYGFDPADSAFWYQHGAHLTADGTLLLSTHTGSDTDELGFREYEIDDASETLHQVRSFGVGLGIEASDMGDAYELPNGDILHNYGTNPRLREVTPDGAVVWDLHWSGDIGRSTALSDLYALAPERP
ncbi:MAG: arylsulfotransferase family protein [Myxococcota bacterium]